MRIAKKVASLAFKVSLGGVLLLAIIITEPTLLATSFIEYKVPTGLNGVSFPMSITTGPDGNLWYTDSDGVQVVRVTTSGVFTVYPMPAKTPSDKPDSITTGPDGNLWFTTGPGNSIDKLTTGGTLTEYPLPNLQSGPDGITVGPDGNLWITEFDGDMIAKVTTVGVFTEYPIPTPNTAPSSITTGPDGNLWFTTTNHVVTPSNPLVGMIGKITPNGAMTEYVLPNPQSVPGSITLGPDGNLWFTDSFPGGNGFLSVIGKVTTSGVFTEYPVPASDSSAQQITLGPDGNLWFTDCRGNNIAEVSTGGSFIEYPLPNPNSCPIGITVGPDHNIWFTEVGSPPRVGELVLSPSVHLKIVKFFTTSTLTPLGLDSNGNPMINVTLAGAIVRSANPGQVLAWVNVTNNSGSSLQSLRLNDTLPVDWTVSPPWMPAKGAIHVFYANGTSLANESDITQPSTITVSTGNPETVHLAISNLASAIGHPLMPGQSILLSVKLTYGLIHTIQLASSYPRNYTDTAAGAAWTQASFTGIESSGTGSAFFIADAKVVDTLPLVLGSLSVRVNVYREYWIE